MPREDSSLLLACHISVFVAADSFATRLILEMMRIDPGFRESSRAASRSVREKSFCAESALCLRSVSVRTIDFGGLTCHRWPCMLLNVRCTVFSNPTLSAILFKTNKPGITCSTPTVPSPTLQECSRKPPEAVRKPSIRRPAEYTAWSESSRLGSPERFPHGQLE